MLFGRSVGLASIAIFALPLDYLAFRIGPLWLVGAATLSVRNGRFVFVVAYALERLVLHLWRIENPDTCFVFSVALFITYIAYPLVFNEVNLPLAETWYDFRQTGVPSLPVFVFMAVLVHYPRWTSGVVVEMLLRKMPAWMWAHFTCSDVFSGTWMMIQYVVFGLTLYYSMLAPLGLFLLAIVTLAWRCLGKAFHDVRVRIMVWMSDNNPPAGYHTPQRLEPNQILPQFKYAELHEDQMRVLYLLPRGNSDTIRCEIAHVGLKCTPVYEAMSYVWGRQKPEDFCQEVYLNDHPFTVTQRVYELLHDRSSVFTPRAIWIDAICINQADTAEKNRQVALMRQIYSRASHVTTWLGVAPNAHLAVDLLLELAHLSKNYAMTDTELWERYLPQRRSARWLALGDMMEHPYFTRIWMVQEVAVNKVVHIVYGGQLLNWDTVTLVFRTMFLSNRLSLLVEDTAVVGRKRYGLSSYSAVFLDRVRDAVQGGEPVDLVYLLRSCWSLEATVRRDKVFALVGLAADSDHELLKPDYTEGISEAEVFTNAAVYLALHNGGLLRVLGCAGIGWPRNVSGLPSWAPDWSIVGRLMLGSFPEDSTAQYRPSGYLSPSPLRVLAGETIMVEMDAIVMEGGQVLHLTSEFQRPVVATRDRSDGVDLSLMDKRTGPWVLEALSMVCQQLGDVMKTVYRHTSQPLEEVFWRTLITDSGFYNADGITTKSYTRPAPVAYGAFFREYMRLFSSMSIRADHDEQYFSPGDPLDRIQKFSLWVTSMQARCLSRRLAVTEQGFMALVPPNTQMGDRIAIIPGVITPMIVRPIGRLEESENTLVFSLVGECYVHGLMDAGEWVRQDLVVRIVIM
ncbi:heterokaryon incompatibility protein-domain-containing protein [Cladorrhinum sp. PSN259]|nr:heterokaryon incompatibility protein-domain-containing protein [Cladorrhinum sp. PSN259]